MADPRMPRVPLNVFQRLVREWETIHPYNGAQLLKIRGPVPGNLDALWHQLLLELGLGAIETDGRMYGFSPLTPEQAAPVLLPEGTTVESIMTEALNRPFVPGESPLRLLVCQCGEEYLLGVAYRHWIADSVAIRRVLRELLLRIYRLDHSPPPHHPSPSLQRNPLNLSSGGYWRLFGPRSNPEKPWSLPRALLAGIRHVTTMKKVRRLDSSASPGYAVRFSHHPISGEQGEDEGQSEGGGRLPRLLRYARARGAKLNDLFLAALGEAVALHAPLESSSKRELLALGTIVDLRALAAPGVRLDDTFSLYLGFTTSFLRPENLASFDAILDALVHQNRMARQVNSPSASQLHMTAGLTAHRLLGKQGPIREFYRKRMPLAAGISNVNMANDPLASLHPALITDCVRASPTGPMMPLVISVTTLGTSLHYCLTRRTSIISDSTAAALTSTLTQRLTSL